MILIVVGWGVCVTAATGIDDSQVQLDFLKERNTVEPWVKESHPLGNLKGLS